MAGMLNRSSTISREIRRNRDAQGTYTTLHAQRTMRRHRLPCRPRKKLAPGSERFELVAYLLRQRFSPEQIARKLRLTTQLQRCIRLPRDDLQRDRTPPVGELP